MNFSRQTAEALKAKPHKILKTIYQPIIHPRNNSIFGFEALLRACDGTSPSVLFQQAVQAGLAVQLDKACIAQAIANRPHNGARLFINMLPQTIINMYKTKELAKVIEQKDCKIVIEVTETQKQYSVPMLKEALAWAKDKGALIAVDDLFNGYDRLQTVSLLTPDFIKITAPRADYSQRSYRATIIGILALARELGSLVIAEKVEDQRVYDYLSKLGIELFQGFYFARPGALYGTQVDKQQS